MRRFRFTITDRNNQQHTVTITAASLDDARRLARREFEQLGFSDAGGSDTLGRIGSLSNVVDLGAPPAVAEPTAIPDGGAGGQVTDANALLGELANERGAFENALAARGVPFTGALGGAAGQFFAPAQATNTLRGISGIPGGAGSFTNLLNQQLQSGGLRGIGQGALDTLRTLSGIQPGGSESERPGQFSAELQPFLSPESFDTQGGRTLQNLTLGGLQQANPFFASRFGQQVLQELMSRFGRRVGAGNQPANAAQFSLNQLDTF